MCGVLCVIPHMCLPACDHGDQTCVTCLRQTKPASTHIQSLASRREESSFRSHLTHACIQQAHTESGTAVRVGELTDRRGARGREGPGEAPCRPRNQDGEHRRDRPHERLADTQQALSGKQQAFGGNVKSRPKTSASPAHLHAAMAARAAPPLAVQDTRSSVTKSTDIGPSQASARGGANPTHPSQLSQAPSSLSAGQPWCVAWPGLAIYARICMYMWMDGWMDGCVCLCLCVCMSVCVYTHTQELPEASQPRVKRKLAVQDVHLINIHTLVRIARIRACPCALA